MEIRVLEMDYTSLLARIVASLVEQTGGKITFNIARLKRMESNARLSFEPNESENEVTVSVIRGGVQEAPLLPLFPVVEDRVSTTDVPRKVIRRTPEEELELIQKKIKSQQDKVDFSQSPIIAPYRTA